MKTNVVTVDPAFPDLSAISSAASIIRQGGLVAFPTETVYGLGANALDSTSVSKIFAAKGRPSDNPLIVHVSDLTMVNSLSSDLPDIFYTLASKYWPGPLTLIVNKSNEVPLEVTGGQSTVALRMPNHAVALELIKKAGVPIAAPSANSSGKPSPTSASHVLTDLNGRIDMVLDGGSCSIGVESTVLDISSGNAVIYRPGYVTLEDLKQILPSVTYYNESSSNAAPKSPGLKYRHYAPSASLILVNSMSASEIASKVTLELRNASLSSKSCCVLSSSENYTYLTKSLPVDVFDVGPSSNLSLVAQSIFDSLRFCDKKKYDIVFCQIFPESGIGTAIMNRLKRASTKILL